MMFVRIYINERKIHELQVHNIGGPNDSCSYDITSLPEAADHRHERLHGFDRERGALALVGECLRKLGAWRPR